MISFYGELIKMMGKLTTSVLVVPGALAVDGEVAELGTVYTRSCSALELILPTTLPVSCIIHHRVLLGLLHRLTVHTLNKSTYFLSYKS